MREINLYISKKAEWLELSLVDSPNAQMQVQTFSGNGFKNDYGDGTWVSYINNQSVTNSFTPNFTGNIHTRTLLGLSDFNIFIINNQTNKYTFDLDALSGLMALTYLELYSHTSTWSGDIATLSNTITYLYLNSTSSTWTGDIATLSSALTYLYLNSSNTSTWSGDIATLSNALTYLRLVSNASTWTGDIATLSNDLTSLYLASSLSPWTYTAKVWSIVPTTLYLRPAPASFTSAMTDQLLIDLSVATTPVFTGKTIDLRGNCGAKTSLSNSAVAIITGGGGIVLTN